MPEGARSARVLVADGSEDEREMYAMQLAQAGFDVLEAADGLTAWTLARRGVDVVIADERLPKLSGLELCRRLKTDAATRRTRVVVLTSGADVWDTVQEALRAGADAVRLKPCYPETLQADIRRLLAGTARPAP
ncbi:MAG TPA: response regulator, partial [Vicinamibacterales bacterium]|nr:response regulator [Vicinamibacterales bacterium]